MEKLLSETGSDWDDVEKLIEDGAIIKVEHEGNKFYMRNISSRKK